MSDESNPRRPPGTPPDERQLPSRIYHGTDASFLTDVLADGLFPRSQDEPGNWSDQFSSHPEMVYLSTTYPGFFAGCAADANLLFLELDFGKLDPTFLYPDEDFLSHVLRTQDGLEPEESQHQASELLLSNQALWRTSLFSLGNVAHLGLIEPSAITRYATLCSKKRPALAWEFLSPSVSTTNFLLLGEHYRKMVAWLFGDEAAHPSLTRTREFHDPALWESPSVPEDIARHKQEQLSLWERESADRTGIEVSTP